MRIPRLNAVTGFRVFLEPVRIYETAGQLLSRQQNPFSGSPGEAGPGRMFCPCPPLTNGKPPLRCRWRSEECCRRSRPDRVNYRHLNSKDRTAVRRQQGAGRNAIPRSIRPGVHRRGACLLVCGQRYGQGTSDGPPRRPDPVARLRRSLACPWRISVPERTGRDTPGATDQGHVVGVLPHAGGSGQGRWTGA